MGGSPGSLEASAGLSGGPLIGSGLMPGVFSGRVL